MISTILCMYTIHVSMTFHVFPNTRILEALPEHGAPASLDPHWTTEIKDKQVGMVPTYSGLKAPSERRSGGQYSDA